MQNPHNARPLRNKFLILRWDGSCTPVPAGKSGATVQLSPQQNVILTFWDSIIRDMWKSCILCLVIVFTDHTAIAGENCQQGNCTQCCLGSSAILCCGDCYCRKPLPCVPCACNCWCPDCYCRKPMPCVPCPCNCWCPDDYCRKPMPCVCCPPPVKCNCCGRGCGK